MGKPPKKAQGDLARRISQAIAGADLSFTKVGETLGVTRSAVSQWVAGNTEPTPENLRTLATTAKVSFGWLATGRGEMASGDIGSEDVAAGIGSPPARLLKVKGYVSAGGKFRFYALDPGDMDEIPATNRDTENAVAVRIMGTSLGRFFDRWYAVYSDVRRPITDDLIGKLCVVGLPDDSVLIKKIARKGAGFELLSNDPAEEPVPAPKIAWAAEVLDIRRGE
jgi:hypothetical protein